MARLPKYFWDSYLGAHNDDVRRSGTPADLARWVDDANDGNGPFEVRGVVVHYMNPKDLADQVGHVSTSIIPAVLDHLLGQGGDVGASYFVGPFAVMAIDAQGSVVPPSTKRLREVLVSAVADFVDAVSEEHQGCPEPRAMELAAAAIAACAPRVEQYPVRFCFAPNDRPRGERLLEYLFDVRNEHFAPQPWPEEVPL